MKNVFKNSTEVTHVWASKSQEMGRTSSSNVYFNRDTIYSYGMHFPMARHLPDGSVAFTTRTFSPTTSGHCADVRRAVSHLTKVYLRDVVSLPNQQIDSVKAQINKLVDEAALARMTVTKDRLLGEAKDIAENFNLYAKAHKARCRIKIESITGVDLVGLKARLAVKAKADAVRKKKLDDERAVRNAAALIEINAQKLEYRAKWRQGIGANAPGDVMLRVSRDSTEVETSRSAAIPVAAAMTLWPIIQRVKGGSKDYRVGQSVGRYTLTQIMQNGDITVGCHHIKFAELEGIAHELGFIKKQELSLA